MRDYGPKPAAPPSQISATSIAPAPGNSAAPAASNMGTAPIPASASAIPPPRGRQIHVRTDVLAVEIDTAGGDIRQAELLKYPVELKTPTELVKVLNTDSATLLIAQSGLQTLSGPDAPGYQTLYTASQARYTLASGEKTCSPFSNKSTVTRALGSTRSTAFPDIWANARISEIRASTSV